MNMVKKKIFLNVQVSAIFFGLLIVLFSFIIPKIMAGDAVVSDLILQGKNTEQTISLTVTDENADDTKVVVPLPEGITYSSSSNPDIGVTYDTVNKQVVIDWVEGHRKKVTLQFEVAQDGIYDFTARTVRKNEPVSSKLCTVKIQNNSASPSPSESEGVSGKPTNNSSQDTTEATSENTPESTHGDSTTTPTEQTTTEPDNTNSSTSSNVPDSNANDSVKEATTKVSPSITNTVIGKDNFEKYFLINGSAEYEGNTGILNLTPAKNGQAGSATLKAKVNMLSDMSIVLQIDVGARYHMNQGGDGLAIGFYNDTPGQVGTGGNSFGLGGLSQSFGFKLDTAFNEIDESDFYADPPEFKSMEHQAYSFGAFLFNDNGYMRTVENSGQKFTGAHGHFEELKMNYSASSKVMTINFDNKTWTQDVSEFFSSDYLSLIISASTGAFNNNHRVTVEEFNVTTDSQPVTVKYIDEDGKELAPSKVLMDMLGTSYDASGEEYKIPISGYDIDETKLPANATGVFTMAEQTVTYVYKEHPGGDVTVNYLDTHGTPLQDPIVLSDLVGRPFDTEEKQFEGYKLKKVDGNTTGTFTDDPQTVTYTYTTDVLKFDNVPSSLSFNDTKIASRTIESSRKDPNWKISVEDNRLNRSNWRVTAKLSSQFQDSLGEAVKGNILLFRRDGLQDQWIVPNTEVNVFDGTSNDQTDFYDVSWSATEGPLLQVAPGIVKAEKYSGVITWNLIDAPA